MDPMNETFFTVPGVAVPKGSRTIYRGRSVESSKRWPEWKKVVQVFALEERNKRGLRDRYSGPVTLTVTFLLPKPQRPPNERHVTRPDLDKLVRGICDALTGILWVDDSQVGVIMAVKRYAEPNEVPSVLIRVARVTT